MPLTLGIGDIPSPQLKVPMTIETWKPNNGPIGGEVREIEKKLQNYTRCFAFSFKESC